MTFNGENANINYTYIYNITTSPVKVLSIRKENLGKIFQLKTSNNLNKKINQLSLLNFKGPTR